MRGLTFILYIKKQQKRWQEKKRWQETKAVARKFFLPPLSSFNLI